MMNDGLCQNVIAIQERDFPQSFFMRCQKPRGHSGDHYAHDPAFDWTYHRRDSVKLRMVGRAEFHWHNDKVWIGDKLRVMDSRQDPQEEPRPIDVKIQYANAG